MYLSYLLRHCMTPIALQNGSFQDIELPEDEMPSANPLDEAKPQEQVPQVMEAYIRIRKTTEICVK